MALPFWQFSVLVGEYLSYFVRNSHQRVMLSINSNVVDDSHRVIFDCVLTQKGRLGLGKRPRHGELAMIAVIFEVWPTDGRKDDYLGIAA
jgi:hypothetical protein